MLTLLGHPRRWCDGLTRRDLLRAGALSLFGTLLPSPVPGSESIRRTSARARAVILVDLFGGPSHLDTFDLKAAAPREIRGEFTPIVTSLPGLQICEHLPRLARWMHRTCLIRTISHGYNSHNPYAVMTGFSGGQDQENYFAKPSDHPSVGSVCQYLGAIDSHGLPGHVCLPSFPGYSQGLRRAGPYGGYLGHRFDPLFTTCDPKWARAVDENKDFYDHSLVPLGAPQLPTLNGDLTLSALDSRRSLLEQFDDKIAQREGSQAMRVMGQRQREAFELLTSPSARRAFDLSKEPPSVRDRYGRDLFGSSVLLARRLVEAGVAFVTVHTEAKGNGHWDTHENNFNMLRHFLLPFLDRSVSALLEELEERSLLETTLVLVTGDMGRTPRVNAKAGRDHWPQCGFCLLAGGGVKAGMVYGCSDKQGAYPKDSPVSPADLVTTIYHLMGVDPESTVPDQTGRPVPIAHGGQIVRDILK